MLESIRRVTGKLSINKTLHCLTLAKGEIKMITETMGVPNSIDGLIIHRNRHGVGSPGWYHLSNLHEQVRELPDHVKPSWASAPMMTLQWKMERQLRGLERITKGEVR
jgi:hypothetical protein